MAVSGMALPRGLGEIGKLVELRKRIFFVLMALLVYRIGTHVPVPGINPIALAEFLEQNEGTILDMFNMFSGGALERMSVCTLNLFPYITASIFMQMLAAVEPKLKQLRKEGESGRRKITRYTRYLTVGLATMQAFGVAAGLEGQTAAGLPIVIDPGLGFRITAIISLVTGTMFLMWLGEQITERGIGNGISIIIFAGIVAGLPSAVGGTVELARTGELHLLFVAFLVAMAMGVTVLVVFVEMGQRRIPVNYAKRQIGRKMYGGQASYLPLKLNMSGVIPPIFASSLILFPSTIVRWFGQDASGGFGSWINEMVSLLQPGSLLYMALFAALIFAFCFFYTAVLFDSVEIADNLKKTGAFIPGMRPGQQTAEYLDAVLTRLTLGGAIYITLICMLPEFLLYKYSVPFYFGGTSLLIVVVVVMDFMSQVQAHLMSHQYEGLMKKANLKGFGRTRTWR